jgi:hypothetical protein
MDNEGTEKIVGVVTRLLMMVLKVSFWNSLLLVLLVFPFRSFTFFFCRYRCSSSSIYESSTI